MTKIEELLSEAHVQMGFSKVEKDVLGVIRLLVNDNWLLHIRIAEDSKALCLYALAGKLPDKLTKELLEMLLEANLYPEANHDIQFSIHAKTQSIILSKAIAASALTVHSYIADLEEFVSFLTYWKEKLSHIEEEKTAQCENDLMKLMSNRNQQIFMV
jgi:hypothetical protein